MFRGGAVCPHGTAGKRQNWGSDALSGLKSLAVTFQALLLPELIMEPGRVRTRCAQAYTSDLWQASQAQGDPAGTEMPRGMQGALNPSHPFPGDGAANASLDPTRDWQD